MHTSDNTKVISEFRMRGIHDENLRVIHNGIDCDVKFNYLNYNRGKERGEMNISDDELAIYFIGRLSQEKNPDIFVETARLTMKNNNKIKFFVVGDGPMRGEIEQIIKTCNNKNITYLGYQTDIPRYLSTADIFILPSKIEGFPLSNIEAMAMNVCVISSDVGGVSDAIKDGENGFLVKPNSASEIAEKIEFIQNNTSVLEKIKKNGRESVENYFSTQKLIDEYRNLYNK